MRIVDVCAFYSPRGGGVRTYIEQKLAIGPTLGHDITILAPGDHDEMIERGPGARIITMKSPRFPLDGNYWYFDEEAALHAELDRLQPDFVEVSSPWRSPNFVARWQADVPRSVVMHADPLSAYAYRWFGALASRERIDRSFEPFWSHLRQLGTSFDRVVCASRELRDRLRDGGVANTALHPMGIEPGVFSPTRRDPQLRARLLEMCELPESAHLLLGVGRLAAEKRWPMIIDAAVAAGNAMPVGLVILGDGKLRKQLTRQIGANPHIRLLKPVRDRAQFATILASADALVHGCEAETFCMAGAEARASGLPLVVPDRGGAADHADGGAGVTYSAGNADSAASAILDVLARNLKPKVSPPRTMEDHFAGLFADYEAILQARRLAA
jgi:alpha-1,6-mannosyltransferase